MKEFISSIILSLWSVIAFAQSSDVSRLPLNLQFALEQAAPDALAHLYVKGDEATLRDWLAQHEGRIKGDMHAYHMIVLPADQVVALSQQAFVERIHFEYSPGLPLLSSSLLHTNTKDVHEGEGGLPSSFTGEGVIVGIIDAGIELQHPDFLYPDSTTRIIELWDQNLPFDAQLTPAYGYGQVWDSAAINDGLCPHQDQGQWFGHGTNTTGIAAANGSTNAEYTGFAPDAELIIVSSNFGAIGWTSTVADAVNYIFNKAEQLGKPCVINASIGTYMGSHDARDLAAVAIEEDITADAGRIMVCAAGNSGDQYPYHLGYDASSDTNFTWFEVNPNSAPGQGLIFMELYGDVDDFERVQFSIGADQVGGNYAFRGATGFDSVLNRLNYIYYDTLWSVSGNQLATVQTWADSLNGTYRLQVLMPAIDSVAYRYRLQITGSGRFDLWSAEWLGLRNMSYNDLPTTQVYPPIQYYKAPDIKQSIVSSWACSDKVITVGNFSNRSSYVDVDGNLVNTGVTAGAIAANSSFGPARTQAIKPDVAAPGDFTLTAGAFFQLNNLLNTPSQRNRVAPGGLHHRAGGTSSASPAVAGIAALFLEKCSNADWNDFKTAITQNAFADQYTGVLPNDRWGYGKADALAALKSTTPSAQVNYLTDELCQGESMQLTLSNSLDSVIWVNGFQGDTLIVDQTGQYFAAIFDERGCLGYSDTANIFVRPLPVQPNITLEADTPACAGTQVPLQVAESFGAYEWSTGSFKDNIDVTETGTYSCTVFNQFGCSNTSEPMHIRFYPDQPFASLHHQSPGRLTLITDYPSPTRYLWRYNNDDLTQVNDSIYEPDEIGVYQAAYVDSNECTHWSPNLNVFALGADDQGGYDDIKAYPNPMSDVLEVNTSLEGLQWEIMDVHGRTLKAGKGERAFEIDVHDLSRGSYYLHLRNETFTWNQALIK
jgi:hypothetical protein